MDFGYSLMTIQYIKELYKVLMPGIKVIHTMTFFYSLHSYANMQVNCHNGRLLCFHVKKNHFKIRLANFFKSYIVILRKNAPSESDIVRTRRNIIM